MLKIVPILALQDNYIWLMTRETSPYCTIVDPGEAETVQRYLQNQPYILSHILVTHHHWDHVNGLDILKKAHPHVVIAGSQGTYDHFPSLITHILSEEQSFHISPLDISFKILATPGHTLDHICYYTEGVLFCGDTLFTGGCGRLFEGSAEQMITSLDKLTSLPDDTNIYCGHEYTEKNLAFASQIDPDNQDLQTRIQKVNTLRQGNQPSVPEKIGLEKATNPFLRCHKAAIQKFAHQETQHFSSDRLSTFKAVRYAKDHY